MYVSVDRLWTYLIRQHNSKLLKKKTICCSKCITYHQVKLCISNQWAHNPKSPLSPKYNDLWIKVRPNDSKYIRIIPQAPNVKVHRMHFERAVTDDSDKVPVGKNGLKNEPFFFEAHLNTRTFTHRTTTSATTKE